MGTRGKAKYTCGECGDVTFRYPFRVNSRRKTEVERCWHCGSTWIESRTVKPGNADAHQERTERLSHMAGAKNSGVPLLDGRTDGFHH
jgi:DNA-directed RNA polymerase subunit RPC12/RpoP